MSGCGKNIQVYIEKGFGYREITVKCGNTSPTGYPWFCEKCEEINADRDFRKEAIEAGEQWDADY